MTKTSSLFRAALLLSLLSGLSSAGGYAGGRVTRAVATRWANAIGVYFNGPQADLDALNGILPSLARLDLSAPEAREVLEPIASQVQGSAELLLAESLETPTETVIQKLAALQTLFGPYLTPTQRKRVETAARLGVERLTPEARGRLHSRMQEIAQALMKDPATEPLVVEGSGPGKEAPEGGTLQPSAVSRENLPGVYLLKAQAPDSDDFTVELTIRADGTYDTRMGFGGVFDRMLAMSGLWTLEKGLFVGRNPSRSEQTTEIQLSGLARAALAKGALVAMKSSQAGRTMTHAFMMAEDVSSLPAVDAAPDDGVEMVDLGTLDRLAIGYDMLEGRLMHDGEGADIELLRRWAGSTVRARGFLAARFESRALGGVVRVFLAAEDGSLEVPLYERAFFRRSKALEHLGSLPVGRQVYALIDVSDRSRLFSPSPFKLKKLSPDSRPAPIALMRGEYVSASGFKATAYRAFPGEMIYSIRADGIADGRPSYVQFNFDGAALQAYNIRSTKNDFTLVGFSRGADGIDSYTFVYGGPFHAWDEKVMLRVHRATGELAGLAADTKYAKWGLPSGWHSGPIKEQSSRFDTGPLSRLP